MLKVVLQGQLDSRSTDSTGHETDKEQPNEPALPHWIHKKAAYYSLSSPPTTRRKMLRFLYPILLPFLSLLLCSCASPWHTISTGTSLQVDHDKVLLISPDTTFSCGFYPSGNGTNAYYFSIWFTHAADKTVVWTADPRFPVNGQRSRISLNHEGNLVLTDVNGSTAWESNTGWGKDTTVALLDTGNLVIKASTDKIIWQSFDSPTNTLLPSQRLTRENRLVSRSDYHVLYFDNDNVLRLLYNGPDITSIYWPSPDYNAVQNGRTRFNSTKIAVLDHEGNFLSSDGFRMVASDLGLGIQRRITIDYDGNFRMYSLNASNGNWGITGEAVQQMCYVHGLCGRNGICEYSPRRVSCTCPPGYEMVDPENWSKGCKPTFSINCGQPHGEFTFIKVPHGDFYGFDLTTNTSISLQECMQICLDSCLCISFTYKSGEGLCYTKNLLYNGQVYPYFPGDNYFKIPKNVSSTSWASRHPGITACRPERSKVMILSADAYSKDSDNISWAYFYTFAAILGAVELLFIMTGWYVFFKMHNMPKSVEEGYKMITNQFRRFTYRELVEATGKFKEELGKGGNGVVYRGILGDKKVVAVKKLTDVRKGEEEFWAEVTLIGRINHMNLVRMYGFCSEGQHRLLVYEFVENESLDRYIFGDNGTERLLSWSQRFKIALGTARGLAYLHHECLEWIVHCDVKPENILLTREFEAKIADFGLSKLSRRDSSSLNFTHMRGTMGYMAPEWVLNLPIDAKVDVYSYGVVLLEIVTGHRVSSEVTVGKEEMDSMQISSGETEGREEMGLLQCVQAVKQMLASGADLDIVDARLKGHFNHEQATVMLKIAISCLDERSKRPTMDQIAKELMVHDDEDYHPAYF